MADFKTAYQLTNKNEGGYTVDDYSETYMGITRKGFPAWQGWALIDRWKQKNGRPAQGTIFNIPGLPELIYAFYKRYFWDKMAGDFIRNQTVANFIYDFAVNTYSALFIVNNALGARSGNTINEDSLKIINERPAFAYDAIRMAREKNYKRIAMNPKKRKYLNGWLSRLNKYPKQLKQKIDLKPEFLYA